MNVYDSFTMFYPHYQMILNFCDTLPGGECDRPFVSTETTLEAFSERMRTVNMATEGTSRRIFVILVSVAPKKIDSR